MSNLFTEFLKREYERKRMSTTLQQDKAVFHDMVKDVRDSFEKNDLYTAGDHLKRVMNFLITVQDVEKYNITMDQATSVPPLLYFCYMKTNRDLEEIAGFINDEVKVKFLILTLCYVEKKGDTKSFLKRHRRSLESYLLENKVLLDDESPTEENIPQAKKTKKHKETPSNEDEECPGEEEDEFERLFKFLKQNGHLSNSSEASVAEVDNGDGTTRFILHVKSDPKKPKKKNKKPVVNEEKPKMAVKVAKPEKIHTPVKEKDDVPLKRVVVKELKHATTQTKQDKNNRKNKEVQVELGIDSEILSVVLDIKQQLSNSNSKEDALAEMKEKCKILEKTNFSLKEDHQKQIKNIVSKHEVERVNLNNAVTKLERDLKIANEKLKVANEFIKSQMDFRKQLQSITFNLYDSKCRQSISFLKSIKQTVAKDHVTNIDYFNKSYKEWVGYLKVIHIEKVQYFKAFENMENEIFKHNYKNVDWPDLPNIFDIDLCINTILMHVSKTNRTNSSPGYSNIRSLNYIQSNTLLGNPTSKQYTMNLQPDIKSVSPGFYINQVQNNYPKASGSKTNLEQNHSVKVKPVNNRQEEMSEKALYEYLMENTGITEDVLFSALTNLMTTSNVDLTNMTKEQILRELKKILHLNTKTENPWITPTNKFANWDCEDSEKTCIICFEEYSKMTSSVLPCKHKFHRECIRTWLKTSRGCPICRVHTVLDEDFPPLS